MLLPSISRRSRDTRTRASNRVARWTNFAARARVHAQLVDDRHPGRSLVVTMLQSDACSADSRSTRPIARRLAFPAQQVRGDPDRAASVIAHLLRHREQIGRFGAGRPA